MKTLTTLILTLVAGSALLSADILTDVGYPGPGGETFSGSGDPGTTGQTYNYSGFTFDPTQFSALYWGPTEIDNVTDSNQGYTGQMSYSGNIGSTYTFSSTADWEGYSTRMLLTVSGLGPEDLESNLGASTTPSYPLFLVTGDYSATFVFQADVGGNWEGVDTAFNNIFQNGSNNGVEDDINVNFDFFTAPASTPEPGTLLLLGSGAVAMGLLKRRARR